MLNSRLINCVLHLSSFSRLQSSQTNRSFWNLQRINPSSERFCHSAPNNTCNEGESAKRMQVLRLEMDIMHQEGQKTPDPDTLKPEQWQQLLTLKSKNARSSYYRYLWGVQMKKASYKAKKEKRRQEIEEFKSHEKEVKEPETHIAYGLGKHSMFLKIYDAAMDKWGNQKLIRAMQFGQKIVLDCGFEQEMVRRENSNTALQIRELFASNRKNSDPFDIHFCSMNPQGDIYGTLKKMMPPLDLPGFPINIHSESITEVFPREDLVYLTPHCRQELTHYNPNDVYVIGAIVDKVSRTQFSLAKAKALGIRMAKLPLDRYLRFSSGSGKSLTINQMIDIMLDLKNTGDWNKALQHVPKRKLAREEPEDTTQQSLSKFKEYKFATETWGAARFDKFRSKTAEKRLKPLIQINEILDK